MSRLSNTSKRVVIVQPRLYHYRVPFYEKLKTDLAEYNIDLVFIHGKPSPQEEKRKDEGHLPWAIRIKNISLNIFGMEILWQPCIRHLNNADLIIIQQENRLILNYLLFLLRKPRGWKIAFWGHGRNFQQIRDNPLRERWKRYILKKADWWFAYTALTKEILLEEGYPQDRITVVQNSIDTNRLKEHRNSITNEEIDLKKKSLNLEHSKIGVFCGSLYKERLLPFLLQAAALVRAEIGNFQLIIIGDGPHQEHVVKASKLFPWVHYMGPMEGRDKVLILAMSDIFLNPGLVGLGILDAFTFGLPLLTTDCRGHGPEIAYLKNGYNGIMTEMDVGKYADSIGHLLKRSDLLKVISKNARYCSSQYSIEHMVGNFTDGIMKAIQ